VTPGQEALAEAARLETARVYAKSLTQHRREHSPGALITTDDIEADQRTRAARVVSLPTRRRTA
jgi:hypothetical protein